MISTTWIFTLYYFKIDWNSQIAAGLMIKKEITNYNQSFKKCGYAFYLLFLQEVLLKKSQQKEKQNILRIIDFKIQVL